jgi:hypothetical protein
MNTSDDYLIGVLLKKRGRARLEGLVTTLEESRRLSVSVSAVSGVHLLQRGGVK